MDLAYQVVPILDISQVAEARRIGTALAGRLGFNETESGKVAIVITEITTNLIKHATGGVVKFRPLERHEITGIEILALDKGAGMDNIELCQRDGYSTTGSPGTGLGAIYRLSQLTDIYSQPKQGTALLSQLWSKPLPTPSEQIETGAICVPKTGEVVAGDAWCVEEYDERCRIIVVDGLGHGPQAADAANLAIKIFRERPQPTITTMMETIHIALQATRGAAAAIAEIDYQRETLKYVGLGNISGKIISTNANRPLISHNGIVGHNLTRLQEFSYPWPAEALVIMYSDGLSSQWNLDLYPGLLARHPSLIAGVIYRDFNRGRDDATMVVVKRVA